MRLTCHRMGSSEADFPAGGAYRFYNHASPAAAGEASCHTVRSLIAEFLHDCKGNFGGMPVALGRERDVRHENITVEFSERSS
jgi:hypothetical protein